MTAKKTPSNTASSKTKTSAAAKPTATRKLAQKSKQLRAKPPKLPKGIPAHIYDLQGSMEIKVPAQRKALLGDEAFKEQVQELEARNVTMVSREAGRVVYVHLPITVRVQEEGKEQKRREPT